MTKLSRKIVQTALDTAGAHVDGFTCKADGTAEMRRGYFYRHGQSAEEFGRRLQVALGEGWTLVDTTDAWAAWPKTSYFKATFKKA